MTSKIDGIDKGITETKDAFITLRRAKNEVKRQKIHKKIFISDKKEEEDGSFSETSSDPDSSSQTSSKSGGDSSQQAKSK